MKRLQNKITLLLLGIMMMSHFSCDKGQDPIVLKPVVTLISSTEITVLPKEEFFIDFSATKGDSLLKEVTVYEDESKVPVSRLRFNGSIATMNPVALSGNDKEGITWSIGVIAQSSANTISTIRIEVLDDNMQSQSVTLNVTTEADSPSLIAISPTTIEAKEGSIHPFEISGTNGSGKLVSIEVRENEMLIGPDRLTWNGAMMIGENNPFLLGDTEKDGFDETSLEIRLPMLEGDFVYKITLTDEFNLTSSVVFNVMTIQ